MPNDFIVRTLFAAASGFIPDLIHVEPVIRVTRADRHLAATGMVSARGLVSKSAPLASDPGEGGNNSETGLEGAAEGPGDL